MTIVKVLTKKGDVLNHPVLQDVYDIWEMLCGHGDVNNYRDVKNQRDWILLTTTNNKPIILQKRFICSIEENE